jgi:hypothetical protein
VWVRHGLPLALALIAMPVLFFRKRKSSYWVDALYSPQRCSFNPAVAHENKRRFTPNPVGAEQPNEIIDSSDRDAVERQKYVALLQASRCCRSPGSTWPIPTARGSRP